MYIDTHSHIYTDPFNLDRGEVIDRALKSGITKIILPNIDNTTILPLLEVSELYPKTFLPLIGLHPTSVKEDFKDELQIVNHWINKRKFHGIGEIGIDLYWNKNFIQEQIESFRYQLSLAKIHNLPVVIHVRNSFEEVMSVLQTEADGCLKGVFHSFTGNLKQAKQVIDIGFKIGVGGIITFKNSGMDLVIKEIELENILLETDSPWLAPVPYRGKRNEPAFITLIAAKIAELHEISIEKVASVTTYNANQLFK